MYNFLNKARPMAAGLIVLLVGCGGSDSGHGSNGSSASAFTIAGSEGYNGLRSSFETSATTDLVPGQLEATVVDGSRTLFLTIPAPFPTEGQTIAVGTETTVARYSEDPNTRILNSYEWKGVGGTIKITGLVGGKASVRLDDVSFKPDEDADRNAAAGTFKLNGSLRDVQFATSAATGGVDFNFSPVTGEEGDALLVKFPLNASGGLGVGNTPGSSVLIVDAVTGVTPRRVLFLLKDTLVAGSTIDYSQSANQATAVYEQTLPGEAKGSWYAISGTLTVVARTSTTVTVSLANVKFTAGGPDNSGSFTLNGTIAK